MGKGVNKIYLKLDEFPGGSTLTVMPLENQTGTGTYKYYLGITFAFLFIIVMFRIRIDFGRLNSDPGSRRANMTHKKSKKLGIKIFDKEKDFFICEILNIFVIKTLDRHWPKMLDPDPH